MVINKKMEKDGATVVIMHQIIDGKQQEYEDWLNEISSISRNYVGHIDWQVIRPIENLTFSYTFILRFDSIDNLKKWMESQDRNKLIKKVRPLLVSDDKYYIRSGLDFLFTSDNIGVKTPVRWKQYLVTWSAIFPLSMSVPLIILPLLRSIKIPQTHFIDSFFVSGIIVLLMVYIVMPNYTKWIKKWLYK